MDLIEWKDEFVIGEEGVDYEHQELIKSINSIYRLVEEGGSREQIISRLGDIYGSISAHFALEERVMQKHHYANYSEHGEDHEKLLDQICEITDEVERGGEFDKARFNATLNDWFLIHFNTHDAKLHIIAGLEHEHISRSGLSEMVESAKRVFQSRLGQ